MRTFYRARDQPWFFVAPMHCFFLIFPPNHFIFHPSIHIQTHKILI